MPEQNDPVDVFDLDAPLPSAAPTATASEGGQGPSMKAEPRTISRKREGGIKQWHVLTGVGVILVGGIVLTSLPSGSQRGQSAPSGVLQPQAAMSSAAHSPERAQERAAPVAASQLPLQAPVEASTAGTVAMGMGIRAQPAPSSPAAAPAAASTAAASVAGPSLLTTDTGALAVLTAQVSATQTSVKELKAEVSKLTQQVATGHEPARRRPASRQGKRALAHTHTASHSTSVIRSLAGVPYTINTIGRGYAWLQAGDHVEIVQPGDRIGATRVLAVDARERRVITSDGIIQ